jgi:hypothetical protein
MKPPPIAVALLVLLLGVRGLAPAAEPASTVKKFRLRDAPVTMAYELIQQWSDSHEVVLAAEVVRIQSTINVAIDRPKPTSEVVEILRAILKEQARVVMVEQPDGVLVFTTQAPSDGTLPQPVDMRQAQISGVSYLKVPLEVIFRRMQAWSGKDLHVAAALLTNAKPINLTIRTRSSAAQVFAVARETLKQDYSIVLDERPDGSFDARLATKPAAPAAAPKS